MFRRKWCGLPPEAYFPSGLEALGYHVNDEDEIRQTADPSFYFKFFLTHNPRVNLRQRFEFDAAVQAIIHERLEAQGLCKVPISAAGGADRQEKHVVPGDADRQEKHVPVFVSDRLEHEDHVVVVFGEQAKELGVIAGRVITGPGGINKGSMVSVVDAVRRPSGLAAGIVLANLGESYWWPQGKRAVTVASSAALPLPSLVHMGISYRPDVNDIPGSESPLRHARSVLDTVLGGGERARKTPRISLVAVGDGCETVVTLLNDEQTWAKWGPSLQCAVFYSPAFCIDVKQAGLKEFLAKRARGYTLSDYPVDTPLSGPDGNPSQGVQPMGFPCYSSGEPSLAELTLISALEPGLAYIQEVSAGGPDFENPFVTVVERRPEEASSQQGEITASAANAWDRLPDDEELPSVTMYDEGLMNKEIKILRRMRIFEATGRLPDSSDSDDSDNDADNHVGRSNLPVAPWPEPA